MSVHNPPALNTPSLLETPLDQTPSITSTEAPLTSQIIDCPAPNTRLATVPKTPLGSHYDKTALLSVLHSKSQLLPLATEKQNSVVARVKAFIGGEAYKDRCQKKAERKLEIIADHLSRCSDEQLSKATVNSIEKSIRSLVPTSTSTRKQHALRQDIKTALLAEKEIHAQKQSIVFSFNSNLNNFLRGQLVKLSRTLPTNTSESAFKQILLREIKNRFSQHEINSFAPEEFQKIVLTALENIDQKTLQEAQYFVQNEIQVLEDLDSKMQNKIEESINTMLQNHCYDTATLKTQAYTAVKTALKNNLVRQFNPALFRNTAEAKIQNIDLELKIETKIQKESISIGKKIDESLATNTNIIVQQAIKSGSKKTTVKIMEKLSAEFAWGEINMGSKDNLRRLISTKVAEFGLIDKVAAFQEREESTLLQEKLDSLTTEHCAYALRASQFSTAKAQTILKTIFLNEVDPQNMRHLSPQQCDTMIDAHLQKTNDRSLAKLILKKDPIKALKTYLQYNVSFAIGLGFHKGLNRAAIVHQAKIMVSSQFQNNSLEAAPFLKKMSPEALENEVIEACNTIEQQIIHVHQDSSGGYLKFNKDHTLDRSLVRTSQGTFELLNSLREDDIEDIQQQSKSNIQFSPAKPNPLKPPKPAARSTHQKTVLGQGAFGKARFARNITTDEICVVKKISKAGKKRSLLEVFAAEKQESTRVPNSENLIQNKGAALVNTSPLATKGYIFMDYAGAGTAENFAKGNRRALRHMRRLPSMTSTKAKSKTVTALRASVLSLAKSTTKGVVDMHQAGLFHRDIKPANIFGNTQTGFKLGDYGLATTKTQTTSGWGTLTYMPPEMLTEQVAHSNEKHDAFSLGLTLLQVSRGRDKFDPIEEQYLTINNRSVPVETFNSRLKPISYEGVTSIDTQALPGNTLDEVIAKLLDQNPQRRISPTAALALPYFNS